MNAPDSAPPMTSPWLRSAAWDWFFMLSGIWLVPIVGVLSFLPQQLLMFSLVLTAVLWLSHRVATFATIFCTRSYRELIRAEPRRFLFVPGMVLIATVLFMVWPPPLSAAISLPAIARLQILGTIFLLFNCYHFGVQHFGVLTIYKIRARQSVPETHRAYERWSCLAIGAVLVIAAQVLHGADVVRESFFVRAIPSEPAMLARGIGVVAVFVIGAKLALGEVKLLPPSLPKRMYIAGIGIQGVAAFLLPPLPFLVLWAVQHWLVSVGLALHMAQQSALRESAESGILPRINRSQILFGAVLGLVSFTLTPLLLLPTKTVAGTATLPAIEGLFRWFLDHETIAYVLIGLNFGTVFCHFLYDRAVFRFSHAPTRTVSGGLLFAPRP